jgi:hypothetical protein
MIRFRCSTEHVALSGPAEACTLAIRAASRSPR